MKMLIKKEFIICIVIVIVIIVGDIFLQKYTKESLNLINDKLSYIKEILKTEELEEAQKIEQAENIQETEELEKVTNSEEEKIEKEKKLKRDDINRQIDEINKEWDKRFNILTCFLEHNELEKVKTQLVSISAGLDIDDKEYVYEELNKTIYILEHIRDKESFKIDNIF